MREAAASTEAAIAALEALRGGDLGTGLGWPEALAVPAPPQIEHDPPAAGDVARPLLDHAVRGLRKLCALERGDGAALVPLGADRFARTRARWEAVAAAGLAPALRVAMLHLDVCKGGDDGARRAWRSLGIDLAVHNLAAAKLMRATAGLQAFGLGAEGDALAIALVESHGLGGQRLRGETPLALFAPWIAFLRGLAPDARDAAVDALHVIDVCDTAAVRAGLVDDALADGLDAIRGELASLAARELPRDVRAIEDELAAPAPGDAAAARAILADRVARLRAGRLRGGEARADLDGAIASLGDDAARALERGLAGCQLWYCEAATGLLTPAAQLGVLATVCDAARAAGIELARPWHAQLLALVAMLGGTDAKARYRRRLVESGRALGTFESEMGRLPTAPGEAGAGGIARAVVVDYRDSEEAAALVTLLAIYEKKSSARFHATLKALCDLYDLRKDDFDRLSNEHEYLAHMNAARGDKARMLDYVVPGRILEVGPGGGVVLDLLEDRFPDAEVIGLDASAEVCDALAARRARDRRRWRVVHADAFALPDQLGAGSLDTVVFCSVLHEIYSYVVRDGRRFRLESVRDLLRAAWTALRPGGRIVIRDGVMPPPGTRRIAFTAPDGRDFFDLFVRDFEGRPIPYRDLADGRVELASGDAMEFLYTYTWGPASFPYEVREQYGVMTYADYGAHLVEWLPGARLVPLPPEIASYLQPGYQQGLADKIALTDLHDAPARLPDSNCLLVVEKAR